MKSVHISIEWKKCQLVASGKNKTIQQTSLRKKIKDQVNACENDDITKSIDEANDKYIMSKCKVFNTAYSLA